MKVAVIIVGGLGLSSLIGLVALRDTALANKNTCDGNKSTITRHIEDTKGVPKSIGVIETEISNIKESQSRTERAIEKISDKLDKLSDPN